MKNYASVIIGCVFLATLVACGARVNQESYEKIQNGMTTQEVNSILGKPTDISSFGIGELSATTAKWVGKTHTITVSFVNEKVKLKSYVENDRIKKSKKTE